VTLLFLSSQRVQAQCLGGSPFTLMPGQSAVAGGQYTNGFLVAPPNYYQPLNYYAPNTMISQPMLVPCTPGFRTGTIPFNHGMQMPNQNPWAAALPSLMGSMGELGSLFTRSDNQAIDFDTFRARRESERQRDRRNTGFTSDAGSGDRRIRPLEYDSRYVELPHSNSAGHLGVGEGAVAAPEIIDRGPVAGVDEEVIVEDESAPVVADDLGPALDAPPVIDEDLDTTLVIPEMAEETPDFIGPPVAPEMPDPNLDLDNPPPTDRPFDPPPAVNGIDFIPEPLGPVPSLDDTTPIMPEALDPVVLPALPSALDAAVIAQETLDDLPNIGLPPLIECDPRVVEGAPVVPPLVQGAYDIMNTFYQSCDASDIIIDGSTVVNMAILDEVISTRDETRRSLSLENRSRYIEHHPILRQIQPGPQCQNILETPAMFSFGAKPLINRSQSGVQIDLFQNQAERCPSSHIECDSLPVVAMDCSGFIQAAMVASGHRVYPDQRDHQERGTSGFLSAALNPESCLRPAEFERHQTLAPGDLVTVHAHHMYMITDVGPDPLGIQRALDSGDCDNLSMRDFDFNFIQSGAAGSIGVARMAANSPHHSDIIKARLYYQAQKTCFEIQNDQPLSPPIEQTSRRTEFMVIRHQGQQRPECLSDPQRVRVQGQECLEDCEARR
jgi:hypothetical protein